MTAAALPVERFAGLGLQELVGEAELLTRVDRKYVLSVEDAAHIVGSLDPSTRVLEIDGARDFAYESVYFDTPDLLSFRMAAQPRRRRFKLRTRAYLDSGGCYLELKTRGARGFTVKERAEYDPDARHALTEAARHDTADALAAIGIASDRAGELDATLVTRYRRTTLLLAGGAARATLDTGLCWIDAGGGRMERPGMAIVETKSASSASGLDRLLWRHGHRPATVSKYATGLAALRPQLPRNRWARLLRGPFDAPPARPAQTDSDPAFDNEESSCALAA